MASPRRDRRERSFGADRDARVALVSFVALGLSCAVLVSVLFVGAETQLPETPAEAQVQGVHFGLEGPDATKEVTVTWSTQQIVREPKLRWAEVGEEPQEVWARNESWYYLGDLTHSVRVTGLTGGTTYQFWPGDEDWGYTGPYNYTVPDASRGLRIGVWSNVGSGADAAKNRDRLLALDPDIVITAGDLAYANGDPKGWRTWFDTMEPLLGGRLHLSAVGHTEAAEANYGRRGYYGTQLLPSSAENYYSVRIGDVDLVVLDSDVIGQGNAASAEHLGWLGDHLRGLEDDATVQWKLAVMHGAPFATGLSDNGRPLRDKVAPLFHSYGVPIVFTGHEGYYERTHVMATGNNVITNESAFVEDIGKGTIYWQTSGGGAALGTRGVKQEWLAYADTIHHVTVVDLLANDTAHVRGVKAADGVEFDHVWIGLGAIPPDAGLPVDDGDNGTADGDDGNAADDDGSADDPPVDDGDDAPPVGDDPFEEKPKEEPGFELVAALAAAALALFVARRRRSG